MNKEKVLLVVNPEVIHVGGHLEQAAKELSINFRLCDVRKASRAPFLLAKFNWHFRGHRPARLGEFGREVIQACKEFEPKYVLSVGLAPLDEEALSMIGKLRIKRLNYLTDDPWNKVHKASWFMKALPLYDYIFTTRKANMEDLKKWGSAQVFYLPFAYSPEEHFPQTPNTSQEKEGFNADIVFAGGADPDRIPYIVALIKNGFKVGLYGGYWKRFPQTRKIARGQVNSETLRKAIACAKVSLCLVRRANRDGNSMRTFEIPAIGGCMLMDDTPEHREIFGEEGKAVVYFKTAEDMVSKLRWLLNDDNERKRLASASHDLIVNGQNTYSDRLKYMLGAAK